jgi:hypothetical protein
MARAAFDRTHRLIANFDYQLPVIHGWSLTGIVLVQSGLPMTLTDPNGGTVYGRAATSTVSMCPGASYATLATTGSVAARLDNWINTAALCAPQVLGSDGSAGYGNAGQSVLNGPGQVNADFSLGKRARVGGLRESAEIAFRVEFYNAMNHPQFSNPGTTLHTAAFGVITQTAVAPRLIQFGVKYLF